MLFSVMVLFIICAVPFQTIKIYFLFTQGEIGYTVSDSLICVDNLHELDTILQLLVHINQELDFFIPSLRNIRFVIRSGTIFAKSIDIY